MKNIVFLLNTLRIGGAEIQTVTLANAFADLGYRVSIISLDSNQDIFGRISHRIDTHIMHKRAYVDFQVIDQLADLFKKFKPDKVFSVNCYATMYGHLARTKAKLNFDVVSVQHTTDYDDMVERIKNLYYRYFINHSHKVVFVSKNQRDLWVKKRHINKNKSIVIHNGIDVGRFSSFQAESSLREKMGFARTDTVLGISASFRPEKRHEDLIKAGRMLRDLAYPVKLLLIGDGERRSAIERTIKECRMEEHVAITGFVQDVRPFISCADIMLLTSTAVETLSIAAIEAMAMKKPLVLSNIGGASELVEDGKNGYLYQAGNIEDLVMCIKKIMDKGMFSQMGDHSMHLCQSLFNQKRMVDHYLALV